MSANLTLRVVEDLDGDMFGPQAVTGVTAAGGSGQVASDDFNRADATTLGSDWTSQATGLGGNGAIISNTATGDAGVVYEFWSGAGSFTDNQYSQATFPTVAAASGSIETGVGVRQSGSGSAVSNITGYFFGANANVGTTLERRLKILKFIAGTPTEIAAAGSGVVLAAGDILKLEVAFSGGVNTLTGYQNGTPVTGLIGVTDSSIGTGGKPGFMCHNSDRCDNWSAGTP